MLENLKLEQKDRVYLEDSVKVKEISDMIINPEEGIPSDQVEIELTAAVDIWYYQQADIQKIMQMAIQSSLPDGLLTIEDTQSIVNVGHERILDKGFRWQVGTSVLAYPRVEDRKYIAINSW